MITSTNLSMYLDDLRLYLGDITGSEYSEPFLLTGLVNSVKYLSARMSNRYLIFSSGIINSPSPLTVNTPNGNLILTYVPNENDVFRNTYFSFESSPPPIIEQQDVPVILLGASYLVRRSKLSSSTQGLSWSTPDLSYSNIEGSKSLKELVRQDLQAIDSFFKFKLGKTLVGSFGENKEQRASVLEQTNWIVQHSYKDSFNS